MSVFVIKCQVEDLVRVMSSNFNHGFDLAAHLRHNYWRNICGLITASLHPYQIIHLYRQALLHLYQIIHLYRQALLSKPHYLLRPEGDCVPVTVPPLSLSGSHHKITSTDIGDLCFGDSLLKPYWSAYSYRSLYTSWVALCHKSHPPFR
jgi:hypothetical protein